jgi:hypothetical protein
MITVLADHFPFVLLDMCDSPRAEEDFRGLFVAFEEIAQRAEREGIRYVILAMTRDTMTAGERRLLASHANRLSRKTMSLCIAGIGIFPRSSALLRGVLTAISWLIPGIPPLLPVASVEEGADLAQSLLRKHDVPYETDDAAFSARWLRERLG